MLMKLRDLKFTKGPWQWNLNESSKFVRLESSLSGRDTVMDFVRFGMNYGQPRFNVNGIMVKCEELGSVVEGREHHSEWFKDVIHPDGLLISLAPDILEKLKKAEEALRQIMKAKLPEEQWGLIVDCDSVLKEITDLLNIEIKNDERIHQPKNN